MKEADRFHEHMKAEHKRRRVRERKRGYLNGTYALIMLCAIIPSLFTFFFIINVF